MRKTLVFVILVLMTCLTSAFADDRGGHGGTLNVETQISSGAGGTISSFSGGGGAGGTITIHSDFESSIGGSGHGGSGIVDSDSYDMN